MASKWRLSPDRAVLVGMVLAALTYCRDLRYDFILDDIPLVLMNETLLSWQNWKAIFVSQIMPFQSYGAVHYRPIYILWFMLNQKLFGLIVPWWHLSSLLLFLVSIFLVYRLGLLVLKEPWPAAIGTLIFSFHPIHVEPVCYITAASDLLVTIFVLLSFLAYYQFRERSPRIGYLVLSAFAGALAVLSKETGLMLPFLLLAFEATRSSTSSFKESWKGMLWTLPHFALVVAYGLIRAALFGSNFGPGPDGSRLAAVWDVPLVLIAYLHNIIWPFGLSFYYPVEWTNSWNILHVLEFAAVLLALLLLWRYSRERAGIRMQLLWFVILMAPAMAAVFVFSQADWVHDRHMFLPSVSLCLIAGRLLSDSALPGKAAAVCTGVILVILFVATTLGISRFTDEVTIYSSALQVSPNNLLARHFYAWALWNRGNREEGLKELRRNTEIWSNSRDVHEYYASALAQVGRNAEALLEYKKVVELSRRQPSLRAAALYHAAVQEIALGQYEAAEGHLREAIQIDPQALNYHGSLAMVLRQEGKAQEADELLRTELSLKQRLLNGKAAR